MCPRASSATPVGDAVLGLPGAPTAAKPVRHRKQVVRIEEFAQCDVGDGASRPGGEYQPDTAGALVGVVEQGEDWSAKTYCLGYAQLGPVAGNVKSGVVPVDFFPEGAADLLLLGAGVTCCLGGGRPYQ